MRFLFALFLLLPAVLAAQQAKRVCGEHTYYAEASCSLNEAKQAALTGARVQALAKEFGTAISQSIASQESSVNGVETSYFSQLNIHEVNGEWIEDVAEPQYEVSFEEGMIVVKCSVCGLARELTNKAVDFVAEPLRNGTESGFASSDFHDGDDLFLLFKSPVDGYVAVYLVDESRTAYCLLPYASDADGQQAVERDEEYVFFSPKYKTEKGQMVDEYVLNCRNEMEMNRLYVIFSPNPFAKAMDDRLEDGLPRQLDFEEFSRWLGKSRKRDEEMGMRVFNLKIRK